MTTAHSPDVDESTFVETAKHPHRGRREWREYGPQRRQPRGTRAGKVLRKRSRSRVCIYRVEALCEERRHDCERKETNDETDAETDAESDTESDAEPDTKANTETDAVGEDAMSTYGLCASRTSPLRDGRRCDSKRLGTRKGFVFSPLSRKERHTLALKAEKDLGVEDDGDSTDEAGMDDTEGEVPNGYRLTSRRCTIMTRHRTRRLCSSCSTLMSSAVLVVGGMLVLLLASVLRR